MMLTVNLLAQKRQQNFGGPVSIDLLFLRDRPKLYLAD